MDGIELATTRELVVELSRRFPKGMLVLGLAEVEGKPWRERFYSHYFGLTACIGMVERIRHALMEEASDGEETEEEEEYKPEGEEEGEEEDDD